MKAFNSRLELKNQISELEYREGKHTQSELQMEKKIKRYEESLRELWHKVKQSNIYIIGVLDDKKRNKG